MGNAGSCGNKIVFNKFITKAYNSVDECHEAIIKSGYFVGEIIKDDSKYYIKTRNGSKNKIELYDLSEYGKPGKYFAIVRFYKSRIIQIYQSKNFTSKEDLWKNLAHTRYHHGRFSLPNNKKIDYVTFSRFLFSVKISETDGSYYAVIENIIPEWH
jgi:hypothetical protein